MRTPAKGRIVCEMRSMRYRPLIPYRPRPANREASDPMEDRPICRSTGLSAVLRG
jgi:hypothetical protein